ncbi:MAG: alpha/beta hydrolase [Rhizobiales bacterium]|nr:alpha/beta hydrolase [Hyphomicrobiales bacterium]
MPHHLRFGLGPVLCLLAGLLALIAALPVSGAEAPREVPARLLPVPDTVSEQLAKFIGAPPNPTAHDEPATVQEWRALINSYNAEADKGARALWAALRLTVTPVTIAGVKCYRIVPSDMPLENASRTFVHVHGGAYVFFGGDAATGEAAMIAHASRTAVISVDYRMPPDHPYPAALDDSLAVWREVIRGRDPAKSALFGSSAGGGLAMAVVLRLKELGGPLPGVLFLGTPWADLTKTGDTYFANAEVDNSLVSYEGILEAAAKLYAAGRNLKDPLLSPLYGDLTGFPPAILVSGTRDLLLSLTVRTHRLLRGSGVEAELQVFEGMSHAQYLTAYPAPEALEAIGEVAAFFERYLAK